MPSRVSSNPLLALHFTHPQSHTPAAIDFVSESWHLARLGAPPAPGRYDALPLARTRFPTMVRGHSGSLGSMASPSIRSCQPTSVSLTALPTGHRPVSPL